MSHSDLASIYKSREKLFLMHVYIHTCEFEEKPNPEPGKTGGFY